MEIKTSEIIIKDRFRKDIGNLSSLKQSIKDIGLLHPVVVDKNYNLIAGYRRLIAFKELALEEIPVTIIDIENVLRGEYDENSIRKDFTPSEAVAIWQALESYQGRRTDIEDTKTKDILKPRSDSDQSKKPKLRASEMLGIGHDKLSKAKQVIEHGTPELIEVMDRTGNVNRAYRAVKLKQDEDKIMKTKPILEAKGLFKTIVIDPPWDYGADFMGRTKPLYATMTIEELMALKLPADDNCHLYLWTTNAFIPKACKLGVSWGFEYKTCITWVKPSIGMGAYFRNSTEHILFFVKGQLSTRVKDIPTHFEAKRLEHSEKPEESYQLIERASYPPYIEIFARKERIGWSARGNF